MTSGEGRDAQRTRTVLRAEGLSCPSCVAKIEGQVGRLAGVSAVAVRFNSGRIEVTHDPRAASVEDLVRAVAQAGYSARPSPF
ncbi:MAG TPA: heavy-metal-associated domain-containing protein [Trueperaceae bacterium]|nr:heavy-metal-associated domain-containing protein [Trueperaceae bacterium]